MQLTVVKIGGDVIDDKDNLLAFLKDFGMLPGAKILVHGGGKIATRTGSKLGIEPRYVDGRRITDAETLDLVTMVYGGLINKKMVAELQATGCNAIGLTGADANILPAKIRPVSAIDYGFVGDIVNEDINTEALRVLLEGGLVPVFAPLTHNGSGSMLNTNADTIAQAIAQACAGSMLVKLIYCMEKRGVLSDPADNDSVISEITVEGFRSLKEQGVISGGMIPKLDNAFTAINSGVKRVIIGSAADLYQLYSGVAGTTIL